MGSKPGMSQVEGKLRELAVGGSDSGNGNGGSGNGNGGSGNGNGNGNTSVASSGESFFVFYD